MPCYVKASISSQAFRLHFRLNTNSPRLDISLWKLFFKTSLKTKDFDKLSFHQFKHLKEIQTHRLPTWWSWSFFQSFKQQWKYVEDGHQTSLTEEEGASWQRLQVSPCHKVRSILLLSLGKFKLQSYTCMHQWFKMLLFQVFQIFFKKWLTYQVISLSTNCRKWLYKGRQRSFTPVHQKAFNYSGHPFSFESMLSSDIHHSSLLRFCLVGEISQRGRKGFKPFLTPLCEKQQNSSSAVSFTAQGSKHC